MSQDVEEYDSNTALSERGMYIDAENVDYEKARMRRHFEASMWQRIQKESLPTENRKKLTAPREYEQVIEPPFRKFTSVNLKDLFKSLW